MKATDSPPKRRLVRKHGLSYTPEYRAWQQMRLRCTDPKHAAWKSYGGRGITVCAEWLDSPQQFLADIGPKPTPRHELDRIDNDRGYERGNCRWALRKVNCRNRRSNRLIEHAGETLPLIVWSERCGISPSSLTRRFQSGWSTERALTTPAREKAPKGQAKSTIQRSCVDCGQATGRTWCKACANRRNGSKNANYSERQALREAA